MTSTAPTLAPTRAMDFEHPIVSEFVRRNAGGGTAREKAVRLYYAVRDGIRYDPYDIHLGSEWLTASRTLELGSGWCVTKAVLLAAACRGTGIPARLGFADVRNHLATERLMQLMDTDYFLWHGYVSLLLDGRWVKATPAFNLQMCRRFDVPALEFDGTKDSMLHPYDSRSQRYMEYVRDRGEFDDLPYEAIASDMRVSCPRLLAAAESRALAGRFETDSLVRGTR